MTMADNGYPFTAADLVALLARTWYPERTDKESGVIRDFLAHHGQEYDRFTFGYRVGKGTAIDDALPASAQRQIAHNTRPRIDILAWRGQQPVIIELKFRVTPASLGQILTYRHLFLEEFPDVVDPELVVIGRESDEDTLRSLQAHNVTVLLYPETDAGAHAAGGAG